VRLFEHPYFDQAILQAADHFKSQRLRPVIIEKDYYVSEVLRIIAATGLASSWQSDRTVSVEGMSMGTGGLP
jgi:hypothetical protein